MGLLDRFSPEQQQLLKLGVPAVAAFALITTLRKPSATPTGSGTDATAANASNSGAPASFGSAGVVMPSTDAIGTGQLADFESSVTGLLNQLAVGIDTNSNLIASIPAPIPTPPAPAPAPAPEQVPTPPPPAPPACQPPAGWPSLPGEVMIKRLDAPGGGCWYFSNFGGVAAVGGAPFKGAAINNRFGPGFEKPPRYAIDAVNLGSGYRIISNYAGQNYDYP